MIKHRRQAGYAPRLPRGRKAHRDRPSKTRVVIIGHEGNRPGEPNMECLESRHQEEVEEATV